MGVLDAHCNNRADAKAEINRAISAVGNAYLSNCIR